MMIRSLAISLALGASSLAVAAGNSFSFLAQQLAPLNTDIASETVTAAAPASISITGGSYSINGGAFTSDPASLAAGDSLVLRQTSAARYRTTTSAVLNADGSLSSFDVTTIPREQLTATSGTTRVAGSLVTVTSQGNSGTSGCGAAIGPYVLAPGGSYTFHFQIPPAAFQIPIGFSSGAGSLKYSVDGNPNDGHSFLLGQFRVAATNCGPDRATSGPGEVDAAPTLQPSSGILKGAPLFTIQLTNPSSSPVSFGVFLTPRLPSDVDGNGASDLLVQRDDGNWDAWSMNGLTVAQVQSAMNLGAGWNPVVSDMSDGEGAEVLWQQSDGRSTLIAGLQPWIGQVQPVLGAGDWSVILGADLNGDGRPDLVFRNVDGSIAAWLMQMNEGVFPPKYGMSAGATLLGPGSGWTVVKAADFDGDGKDDLLWRNDDGRFAIWLMNGLTPTAQAEILPAGNWTAVSVADLDGDGKADIVWQNSDGTIAAWLMNGTSVVSGATLVSAGSGWTVSQVGDFDGDGKPDILFRHSDGRAAIWLMNGLVPVQQAEILPAGLGWNVKRLGDFNRDGKMDIVWQHDDGRIAIWLMDGVTPASTAEIAGAGTGEVAGLGP